MSLMRGPSLHIKQASFIPMLAHGRVRKLGDDVYLVRARSSGLNKSAIAALILSFNLT